LQTTTKVILRHIIVLSVAEPVQSYLEEHESGSRCSETNTVFQTREHNLSEECGEQRVHTGVDRDPARDVLSSLSDTSEKFVKETVELCGGTNKGNYTFPWKVKVRFPFL
jgi:hypothetical protein